MEVGKPQVIAGLIVAVVALGLGWALARATSSQGDLESIAQAPSSSLSTDLSTLEGAPGDPIQVRGSTYESPVTMVDVTLGEIVDPAPEISDEVFPGEGNRYVVGKFTISNVGEKPYESCNTLNMSVVSGDGQQFEGADASIQTGYQGFVLDCHILPGDSRSGYVLFEIPGDAQIAQVQFNAGEHNDSETATWVLPSEESS